MRAYRTFPRVQNRGAADARASRPPPLRHFREVSRAKWGRARESLKCRGRRRLIDALNPPLFIVSPELPRIPPNSRTPLRLPKKWRREIRNGGRARRTGGYKDASSMTQPRFRLIEEPSARRIYILMASAALGFVPRERAALCALSGAQPALRARPIKSALRATNSIVFRVLPALADLAAVFGCLRPVFPGAVAFLAHSARAACRWDCSAGVAAKIKRCAN